MMLKIAIFLLLLTSFVLTDEEKSTDKEEKEVEKDVKEIITELNKIHKENFDSANVNPHKDLVEPDDIPLADDSDDEPGETLKPNYEGLRIAKQWNLTFNVLDAFKHFSQNKDQVEVIAKYTEDVSAAIDYIDDDDVMHIIMDWPSVHPDLISRRFLVHYSDVNSFFKHNIEYNRAELERAVWIPWNLAKYEGFFKALNKIEPFPFDIRKMQRSLKFLSEKTGQLEIIRVYDALQCFDGLRYSRVPRDKNLFQRTKKFLLEMDFLVQPEPEFTPEGYTKMIYAIIIVITLQISYATCRRIAAHRRQALRRGQ